MHNVFESESIIFKELDLFYHYIMLINLFDHIFDNYGILRNRFYGFADNR